VAKDSSGFVANEYNLMQYAGADPVNFVDLEGEQRAPVRQPSVFNRKAIRDNYGSPDQRAQPHVARPPVLPVTDRLWEGLDGLIDFMDQAFQIGEFEIPVVPCDLVCRVRPRGPVDNGRMCVLDDGTGPIMHSPTYNPLNDSNCSCR
jgi:hypothetical protein